MGVVCGRRGACEKDGGGRGSAAYLFYCCLCSSWLWLLDRPFVILSVFLVSVACPVVAVG